jgi:DNA repair exonuclease SbcCD ATPase subunit
MPFQAIPKADAEKLIAAFTEIKKQHTSLNKGANKLLKMKEIKKLEKEMKEAGDKAGKKMVEDLGKVRINFEQHAQNIQKIMVDCAQLLATAEKAVKRYEEDPTPFETLQAKGIASRAAEEIGTKVEEAKAQDLDYGKSWFEYRGYNPVKDGLDENYATKAADLKSALMNDGKPVTAKIKTMASLQEKAQALVDRVEAASKRGMKEIEDQRESAKKLAGEAAKIANAIENTKGNNLMALKNTSQNILLGVAEKPVKPDTPRVVRDYITNITSADKFLRERFAAMKRLVDSIKKEFDAEELKDDEIAKSVQEIMDAQKKAKDEYDELIVEVKKAIEAGVKFIAANKK